MHVKIICISLLISFVFLSGCSLNGGIINYYHVNEASWIRKGEPIEFEEDFWYPTDTVENFLGKEMLFKGKFKGVKFFTERKDIRPFSYLYTKFDENQFRTYEKNHD